MIEIHSDDDLKEIIGTPPWNVVSIDIQPFYPEIITIVDADMRTEICVKTESEDCLAETQALLQLLNRRESGRETDVHDGD